MTADERKANVEETRRWHERKCDGYPNPLCSGCTLLVELDRLTASRDLLDKHCHAQAKNLATLYIEQSRLRGALEPIVFLVKDFAYKAPEQLSLTDFLNAMGRLGAAAEHALAPSLPPPSTEDVPQTPENSEGKP